MSMSALLTWLAPPHVRCPPPSTAAGLSYSPLFFAFHLLDMANKSTDLQSVFKAVTVNGRSILMTALFGMVVIYLYAILGYAFIQVGEDPRAPPRLTARGVASRGHRPSSPVASCHLPSPPITLPVTSHGFPSPPVTARRPTPSHRTSSSPATTPTPTSTGAATSSSAG